MVVEPGTSFPGSPWGTVLVLLAAVFCYQGLGGARLCTPAEASPLDLLLLLPGWFPCPCLSHTPWSCVEL